MSEEPRPTPAGDIATIRRLRPLFALLTARHRILLAAAVTAAACHQILVLASGAVSAWLVGQALGQADAETLRRGLLVLAVLVPFAALTPLAESYLAHVAAFEVLAIMRSRVFEAFERLAPAYLLTRRSGDLGATISDDVEQLELFYAHTLAPLAVACITPLTAIVVLGFFHWLLSVVLLVTVVLLVVLSSWSRRGALGQGDELRSATAELSAQASGAIHGLRELVIFGAGEIQKERIAEAGLRLRRAKTAHARRSSNERSVADALTVAGLLGVLAASAWLVASGRLDVGWSPVAVVIALTSLTPVLAVADVARDLNVVAASAARIDEVLRAEPAVSDLVATPPAGPIVPEVEFERVDFRYEAGEGATVHDLTFTVHAGQTVAIVGHSGAGKSTCAHLLMRLWDADCGIIRIGGHDIRDFPQENLRDLVTVVPQDAYLFAIPVADNIRLSRPGASDEEIRVAARAALADDFIAALPNGYATTPGEMGTKLSGGQRQRIALARAMLKDSPILVLDESVSNLDTISEEEVNTALMAARRGRTTIIIAHRLSTIRRADRIIVLAGGTVAQIGTHDELIARPGVYRDLVGAQLIGGARKGNDSPL